MMFRAKYAGSDCLHERIYQRFETVLNKTKKQKTKNQNLTENFWFRAQRCFFGVEIEKPKNTLCVFVFLYLMEVKKVQKTKKQSFFLVFQNFRFGFGHSS